MAHVPFTAVLNYSGSSSAVYAALSSTLMASFVFCPQDTIIRMAEESRRPEKSLPKLMVGSTISSLLIGFPIVIALNYGITKAIKGLLDENVPGIRIILSTMGDSTGTVFVSFILLAIFFTGLIRLSAATRTVYSFARDGGLPHSVYWNHLHPRRKTPQRISWLVTIACMCCIFPFFWGNTVAFHWISSLGCITANISFAIPMFMRLTREGNLHFIPGKFTLGRFSKPLNIISIIWLSFLSLFLMFPSTLPVTKNNFNYAPIVLVILTFIFAVSWFKARTDFTGGAKDVSRASHRIPSRVLEDVYPRKPPSQLHSSVAPQSTPSFHWPPSDDTVQRFKLPFDKKARGKVSASGQNKVLPEQANRPWPGYSIPLTPLRPGFMPPSSPSSKKQKQAHQGAPFGNLTSTVGSGVKITSRPNPRDKHHRQAPSQTMITVTSVQSHPDSILGIPLTESPEMMYGELPIQVHEPSIPPSPPASETHATSDSIGHECSSVDAPSSSSGLFLTRPFESAVIATNTGAANAGIVPEISIAPPTTNSSTIESDRATPRHQSLPPAHPNIVTVAARPDRRAVHHSSLENRAHSPIQEPHPTAIESDFKLRQGISNIFVSGKNKVTTSMNSNNSQHRRTDKNRVLTPYPSSLINPTEESVISDYVVSTIEDSHYDHQPSSTKTILKVSPPSPPLHPMHPHDGHTKTGGNGGGFDGAKYSIKDIINNTKNSLTALPSISQFPTLDGYPLIKSPSTNDLGVETSEGDGRRPSNTNTIRPPELLPLSRSPTIQATNQVYTQTSSLEDVDLNEQLIEADESYEYEYHHDYPVISSSNNRLQSLSPIITGASINGGLFRLSNRDISAASNLPLTLTPSGSGVGCGVIKSSSLITHSTGPAATPTTVLAPASPGANQQHDQPTKQNAHYSSSYSERHDPIERLLLQQAQQQQQQQQRGNNSIPTSTYDLLDSYTPSTALQLLQRTRTVADWAQEQSRIQEKRAKHYARTRALKELRKQDPTATLSVHSESSDLSSFSEVSSFSTSTVSLSEREKTTSTATASTSRAGPASPPNSSGHHHNRQHFQPRSTPPTSLTLLPNEKLTINTNVPGQDEAKTKTVEKMPPFFPRYLSGNKKVASSDPTMEDTQLDQPTRLEMLIREVDEDEEEEEPGLYVDTDDVMSPSMEVESLGAGVGRL
ncbi:hypothetical protein FBU30_005380 [Linnemannia zychae]|nr:hypothetical protein FBU30_005380 [Linnemannia zychae]